MHLTSNKLRPPSPALHKRLGSLHFKQPWSLNKPSFSNAKSQESLANQFPTSLELHLETTSLCKLNP